MEAAIDIVEALTTSQVLEKAKTLGVVLTVSGGELRAIGGGAGIAQLAKDIKAHKPELIKQLTRQAPSHADLAVAVGVAGCPNCEASINQKWAGGGYTMQCVGCMARLVLSARPLRHAQEAMLACNDGRPDRPSRQSVLDWLKAKNPPYWPVGTHHPSCTHALGVLTMF